MLRFAEGQPWILAYDVTEHTNSTAELQTYHDYVGIHARVNSHAQSVISHKSRRMDSGPMMRCSAYRGAMTSNKQSIHEEAEKKGFQAASLI